jgi:hypothetical protein
MEIESYLITSVIEIIKVTQRNGAVFLSGKSITEIRKIMCRCMTRPVHVFTAEIGLIAVVGVLTVVVWFVVTDVS